MQGVTPSKICKQEGMPDTKPPGKCLLRRMFSFTERKALCATFSGTSI